MVQNVHFDSDAPSFVGELKRVGQKVKENLKESPFVPNYRLNQIEMAPFADYSLQLNPVLGSHKLKHL